MKTGVITSVVLAVAVALGPFPLAHAAGNYESCAQMRQDFPTGVAQSRKAARQAVRAGFSRPAVSKSAFRLNRELVSGKRRAICLVKPSLPTYTAPTPVPAPQPVANLTVVADQPERRDANVTFTVSWQVPAAADITGFYVRLQDGSQTYISSPEGVLTTPEVKTFSKRAFGPFGAQVTVVVTAVNASGSSTPASFRLTLPEQPKLTYTVELKSTFQDCNRYYCSSYISIANGPEDRSTTNGSQTRTYEAEPGAYLFIYNDSMYGNETTCTITIDGVVVESYTGFRIQCDYRIPYE